MDDQADTRAFLRRLTGAAPLETQISAVFVGPDTTFKLKRAVQLSFLDYRSIKARRRFLHRELELNQPAAPGLYRDVVAITREAGGLALGGPGPAVDHVLRMATIPAADFLLERVRHPLPDALLDALGDMVAADHARRPPAADSDPGHPGRNAEGNARAALAAGLPPEQVAAWLEGTRALLDGNTPLLATRARAGLKRRTHGDMHLGNICLWHGVPVPFDALEFDEAMATTDLAYDLAFPLMDLVFRAGRPAANRLLNRYVARTGDAALVRLLPAFLSRRAMVRAHVTGDTAYLEAALGFLRPAPAPLVAIGGLPGTGKSTLARALAPGLGPAPGALILRSDEIRKRLHGVAPEQRLGREAYTATANARVDEALLNQLTDTVGHAVILDASFLSPFLRHTVGSTRRPFTGIWLEAPMAELERRVRARSGDASDATVGVLHGMAARGPGPLEWHRVAADESAVARCTALLAG